MRIISSLILFTISFYRGSCIVQTTAVEGVSDNVMILCDLHTQMAAPFWRINDRVYDIFHVPAYFKVESYRTLTIPKVSRSFNNYTFQCILIDHTTDPIREINGTLTELTVVEGTTPALVPRDLLELDYQQLRVDSDYITVGWIYSFSDCELSHFTLEGFTLDDVLTNSLQEPTLVHNSTTNIVTIPSNNVLNNGGLYFRLSAFGENGEHYGSGTKSQQIFYNLHTITGTREVVYGIPGETLCVPIPDNFTDGKTATPVFVWPANPSLPGDCYCPPYENVGLTRFSDCVVTCNTTYSIGSVNESICFSNFTSPTNKAQVYFVTLKDQCNFPDCFIRKIVASYKITLITYSVCDFSLENEVHFSELSPSTAGVTFTVVCSNNIMSCIEEETSEFLLLQVSLFKISLEAMNITSSTINCNRSSNFNSLQPHTDYMLIICFSDLQCVNTTFTTGYSIMSDTSSFPLLVIGLLSLLILICILLATICYLLYTSIAEQKAEDVTQNPVQSTPNETEGDYNTIQALNIPTIYDYDFDDDDIETRNHIPRSPYTSTSNIPLEVLHASMAEQPQTLDEPQLKTASEEPLNLNLPGWGESENTTTYQNVAVIMENMNASQALPNWLEDTQDITVSMQDEDQVEELRSDLFPGH